MSAFIPALFFMIVVTTIEWVPVLRVNEESWLFLMLFPLIVCNAFQLLMLPKLNQRSIEERSGGKPHAGKQGKSAYKKPSNV
jgi:KinB signaling pathway activation protein